MPTWDSAPADDLWTEACGKDRWLGTTETLEQDIRRVSDASSGNFAPPPADRSWNTPASDCPGNWPPRAPRPRRLTRRSSLFDPNALTLGFARRFATYKRPNLLLHDPERLLRLLTNPQRPVQLIIAGKAHPADQAGRP
jgi:glycogen phosphorylase